MHAQVAKLDRVMAGSSLLPGDVLRGVTATNFVYPTQALFGAQAPRRTIVLYGADNQRWPKVCLFPLLHPVSNFLQLGRTHAKF